jgi:hypothetical protein
MLFNDLLNLYEEVDKTYHISDQDCKYCLENKKFEKVPGHLAKKDDYLHFKKKLKPLLKEYFKKELEEEILKMEKEYEKEKKMNESIWKDYGSELAGDLDKNEKKIGKKIKLLKGIFK